jgi:hypothetical protein
VIADTYSFTEAHYDPGCRCVSTAPSLNTACAYSNRFVSDPDAKFGHMRFYSRGSWVGNHERPHASLGRKPPTARLAELNNVLGSYI